MVTEVDILNAKILVVDDKTANVRLLEGALRQAGYLFIDTTESPLEVCALHQKHSYDLILLDLLMPGMDGFQVMEELKSIETQGYLPVLVVTAQPEHKLRALKAGAKDFVSKPIDLLEVLTRAHNILEVRLLHTEVRSQYELLQRTLEKRLQVEEEVRVLNVDLELRVAQRTAELEVANKELESFSYSVSHDLRSPLRGIDGWSHALLEDYYDVLDATGRKYLDMVRSETQRMGHLIDDMLELARVMRAEIQKQAVDLTTLAKDVVVRQSHDFPSHCVDVQVAPDMVANGDKRLLEIVLNNLIGNAFKFTTKTLSPAIEVGQVIQDKKTTFFVRDNGAGFDMNYSSRLFSPFHRLHKLSEFPGTGVGLATVQRIIGRHGGTIWAEAAPDKGATFSFTLEEAIP